MNTFPPIGLFSDPAIKTALLTGLEKQLNAALALDPVSKNALGKMAGIVIEVHITELRLTSYLCLEQDLVRLFGYYDEGA